MNSREKMWAFMALLASTFAVMMAVILIGRDGAEPIVQLVDKYQNGIIGILGMAAGLLFRNSAADNDTAAAVRTLAEKASPEPGSAQTAAAAEAVADAAATKADQIKGEGAAS
jgi:hypothetical protein